MKIKATLTISNPSTGGVSIRIHDEASGIQFLDAAISHEEFSRALGHLYGRPFIECEVRGLEYVGKKRVTEQRSILCPLTGYDRKKLEEWLDENAKEEGWLVSTYLGSRGSVESVKSGGQRLNYSVTKYVEET